MPSEIPVEVTTEGALEELLYANLKLCEQVKEMTDSIQILNSRLCEFNNRQMEQEGSKKEPKINKKVSRAKWIGSNKIRVNYTLNRAKSEGLRRSTQGDLQYDNQRWSWT